MVLSVDNMTDLFCTSVPCILTVCNSFDVAVTAMLPSVEAQLYMTVLIPV